MCDWIKQSMDLEHKKATVEMMIGFRFAALEQQLRLILGWIQQMLWHGPGGRVFYEIG